MKHRIWVFFILFLICVLPISTQKLNNEPKCTFPDTIVVENHTDHDVDYLIKVLLNKVMKYDTMNVILVNREKDDDVRFSANIVKVNVPNTYMIFLASVEELTPSYYHPVFSHEMLHLLQFQSGLLKLIDYDNSIYQYGDEIICANEVPYYERQYEIDAYQFQEDIYEELQLKLCDCQ